MSKRIIYKTEEKKALFDGINAVATLAGSTMGAAGKPVVISRSDGTMPIITNDGVTVVANVTLDNELENVGATLLKDCAGKTVEASGDGTTASVVLANAIIIEGLKVIGSGAKSQFVKQGIDLAIKAVVEELKNNSEPILADSKRLIEIATVSANNDSEIGGLIADVYSKIGKNGMFTIENSITDKTYTKVVDGFEFNRGYIHKDFINNYEKMQVIFENPYILVTDYEITRFKEVQSVLESVIPSGRPILIIATDATSEAWGTFLLNRNKGILDICLVKAPTAYKKQQLSDIAVLTGATVITDDAGIKLTSAKMQHLGSCDKVVITDKKTAIIGGRGEPTNILARKSELLVEIEQADSKEKKEIVEQRLAQVSGSVAVIYVGGLTEVEIKERYDRVDDSVKASKAAIQEGISCGGGISLLRCIPAVAELKSDNADIVSGFNVIKKALEAPLRQMLRNAEAEESLIVGKLLEEKGNVGYNMKTFTIENLKDNGVIDPTKVIRVALENAASLAGTLLSTDYLLIEMKNK